MKKVRRFVGTRDGETRRTRSSIERIGCEVEDGRRGGGRMNETRFSLVAIRAMAPTSFEFAFTF